MTLQGSAPVSAGAIEGARARSVVAKSDSGHGADTSVLDGELQDLQALLAAMRKTVDAMPLSLLRIRARRAVRLVDAAVLELSCYACNDRVGTDGDVLDGFRCHECFITRVPASGPDDDAAYEEAVGK